MVKAILNRSSWQFAGLALGKVFSVILFILLARILQPDLFGQVALFVTVIQLVTALANFGLKPWFQTRAHELGQTTAFHFAFSARLLSWAISVILTAVYLVLAQPFSLVVSIILLVILMPEGLTSFAESYWLLNKKSLRVGMKTPLFFVIVLIVWVVFAFSPSLTLLASAWLLASVATMLWFFPWKAVRRNALSPFTIQTLKTLKQSSSYALLTTTSLIYSRADQLIIQTIRGFSALGIYSAAYRMIDSLNLLPQAIAENVFPEAAQPGKISLKHVLKIELIITVLGGFVALVLYVLAPFAVSLLLGAEYVAAIPLIRIFSIVIWLFFINAPMASVVQSSKLIKKFLPFGIANTVSNVLLNILLVPLFGLTAAAWTMVATEATGLLINVYFLRRLYKS